MRMCVHTEYAAIGTSNAARTTLPRPDFFTTEINHLTQSISVNRYANVAS